MLNVRDEGSVRILTLDRPEKSNALHPELLDRLRSALEDIEGDGAIHVVVLTGAGKRFCAGLDLKHLVQLDAEGRVEYMGALFAIFQRLHTLRQPVIAAVNGPAMAGGFDLAAFCDIRICSTTATFAQTEILLGLTQVAYPLYKVIGLSRAAELALTGKAIGADEAYRIGLVSSVHDEESLLPSAMELAAAMAARPPEALFETKRLTREVIQLPTDRALTRMFDTISARLRSEEHARAVADYMERLKARS